MNKKIVIGIAGASGVIYGVRMLQLLKDTNYETHLIISEAAKLNIEIETRYRAKAQYRNRNQVQSQGSVSHG